MKQTAMEIRIKHMAMEIRIKQRAMEMAIMAMLALEMAMSLPPPMFSGLGAGAWKVRS